MLSRHDLIWLVEMLSDVQAKWYIIGVQLNLPSGDLDAINKDNLATSMALTSMLKLWLAGANPSVDVLSKALQTKIVAESRLGLEILMETCELTVYSYQLLLRVCMKALKSRINQPINEVKKS